jgi:peroxiredoxin Q/BCP
VDENAAFAAKFDFPFPLLCDVKREIGLAYGACDTSDAEYARRITYLIGPDGRILKAYPAVKAAEHPRQVLADLTAVV